MDALIGVLNDPLILLLVQLVFGALVKKWSVLASWPNRLIPLFNALIALAIKLGGPGVAHAGGVGGALAGLGSVVVQAGLATLLATGVHSTAKNFWQKLKEIAVAKAVKAVS